MKTLVLWLPRIAGIVMALFLSVFALDSLREPFPEFLLHLIPAFLLLGIVYVAWRRPVFGAVMFALLGVGYGLMTMRLNWFLAIGVPLLAVSALYAVNARMAPRV